jgi:cellulose 1,4-beta-cellobiosidase
VSGYVCTYSNAWYSQCLPGTATTTAAGTTTKATTTSTKAGSTTSTKASGTTTAPSGGSTTAAASGNPFSGVALYANPYYASEISASAIPSLTGAMATKAAAVAKVPTFVWL